MHNRFAFVGGATGRWKVRQIAQIKGEALATVAGVDLVPAGAASSPGAAWTLTGLVSNLRYTKRTELDGLRSIQEPIGRPHAAYAALIPIKKSAAWWDLAQDERRAIFEETSQHNAIGMQFLPAIARQLFHSRDLGEPFDFLTLFEFAPTDEARFDDLVARLRATREWTYVEREIDIRLERA